MGKYLIRRLATAIPTLLVISFVVFAASVALSGFVSVGSLLASALMVIWLWLLGHSAIQILTAAVVAGLIWFKHHENIGRLLKGEEKSWKKKA